jgi:acetyl esterase/lipase
MFGVLVALAGCASEPAPAAPIAPLTVVHAVDEEPPQAAEEPEPAAVVEEPEPPPAPYPGDLFARPRTCEIPPEPATGFEETLAIEFRRAGGVPVLLDLARPSTPGPHPLVVFVHGGGWRVGERVHLARETRIFAGLGYAAATLDYRLAPEHVFPAAASDVRCAVRYLSTRTDLGIDPRRIGLVGFSSGAHLVALAAMSPSDPALDDVPCEIAEPARVRAVVGYFGIYDLRRPASLAGATRNIVANFLGPEASTLAPLASPIVAASAESPAMLFVHGSDDEVIPISESIAMRNTLRQHGVPTDLVRIEGIGHGFILRSQRPEVRPATCATLAFLERTLEPAR